MSAYVVDRAHIAASIAAGTDYRREYVARAMGKAPTTYGTPYWD